MKPKSRAKAIRQREPAPPLLLPRRRSRSQTGGVLRGRDARYLVSRNGRTVDRRRRTCGTAGRSDMLQRLSSDAASLLSRSTARRSKRLAAKAIPTLRPAVGGSVTDSAVPGEAARARWDEDASNWQTTKRQSRLFFLRGETQTCAQTRCSARHVCVLTARKRVEKSETFSNYSARHRRVESEGDESAQRVLRRAQRTIVDNACNPEHR